MPHDKLELVILPFMVVPLFSKVSVLLFELKGIGIYSPVLLTSLTLWFVIVWFYTVGVRLVVFLSYSWMLVELFPMFYWLLIFVVFVVFVDVFGGICIFVGSEGKLKLPLLIWNSELFPTEIFEFMLLVLLLC